MRMRILDHGKDHIVRTTVGKSQYELDVLQSVYSYKLQCLNGAVELSSRMNVLRPIGDVAKKQFGLTVLQHDFHGALLQMLHLIA